jgi:hypothetical protein
MNVNRCVYISENHQYIYEIYAGQYIRKSDARS